jgi:4-hydroxy-4-methyl-2-oxoglutarate aldolase
LWGIAKLRLKASAVAFNRRRREKCKAIVPATRAQVEAAAGEFITQAVLSSFQVSLVRGLKSEIATNNLEGRIEVGVDMVEQHIVYLKIPRPPAEYVTRGLSCPMSDLYEGLDAATRDEGLMSPEMRPLNRGLRIFGPAITVLCAPGDNLVLHKALLLAQPGDVLVVQGGRPSGAQWGDLAAIYAQEKGLAGVVVDGCVRDCDALIERRYPVWSTSISAAHPEKRGPGSVNVPIVCDSVRVFPGDLVSADTDGVLVIKPDQVEQAIVKAEMRQLHEAQAADAIRKGRSLFELHDLQAAFDASDIVEVDAMWAEAANSAFKN